MNLVRGQLELLLKRQASGWELSWPEDLDGFQKHSVRPWGCRCAHVCGCGGYIDGSRDEWWQVQVGRHVPEWDDSNSSRSGQQWRLSWTNIPGTPGSSLLVSPLKCTRSNQMIYSSWWWGGVWPVMEALGGLLFMGTRHRIILTLYLYLKWSHMQLIKWIHLGKVIAWTNYCFT